MLNSLANHGWLKRSGLNLSIDDLVNGLDAAINLSPASSRPVAELAVTTGNGVTLNLDDLNKHGGTYGALAPRLFRSNTPPDHMPGTLVHRSVG